MGGNILDITLVRGGSSQTYGVGSLVGIDLIEVNSKQADAIAIRAGASLLEATLRMLVVHVILYWRILT